MKRRGVKHVRLLIVGGVHHLTEPIVWDYSPKGSSVVFDTASGTGRVVFDGSRMNTARAARYPGETTCATYLLCIKAGYGSFTISGKTFQNAPNGIRLKGNTNITITGNVFKNLSGSKGYGGIHTESSSGLKIKNNLFSKLKNSGKMHGIYLVRTSRSTISGNRFEYVTGDPVRVRVSSNNLVSGNKFYRSGSYATFSEWRDTTKGEGCGKGNVFSIFLVRNPGPSGPGGIASLVRGASAPPRRVPRMLGNVMVMSRIVKLVVQVKLLPTPEQALALEATLHAVNVAATRVSAVAFDKFGLRCRETPLRRLCYAELKAAGLGAQAAQHVIKRVVDAYTALRAGIRNGNLGGPASRRRRKAESKPVVFRPDAAHTFDDRNLSWRLDAGTVSIWTVHGRCKNLRLACSPEQARTLAAHRHGESDLVHRDGMWFLLATCDIPEPDVYEPADWIGVDRGIVNLATTSDGDNHQGRRLGRYRRWQARKRAEIQAKRTRSAARLLKKRARREARHARHVNHKISRQVVAVAARTGRGIALEELGGIRERVTVPRDQRARLSSWPFHQLGEFLEYKARRAGVPFLQVDAAYTSQRCPRCGHTARNNRPSRDHFCCRRCGLAGPADVVAGVNVRDRARSAWVFVNMPAPAPA
ncbi:RNA-guided endonuclease TnpB family protein [Actinomadura formosensis]|uniref:RNA-guided endonuclease TnpB family protein n=1 Tax=Actinomadura formosensis TaxID=60706 RepID=UPI003D8D4163